MMIRKPDIESVRLWTASEAMASELDNRPTIILKTASRKLIKMKRYPDLTIVWLRFFDSASVLLTIISFILAYFGIMFK